MQIRCFEFQEAQILATTKVLFRQGKRSGKFRRQVLAPNQILQSLSLTNAELCHALLKSGQANHFNLMSSGTCMDIAEAVVNLLDVHAANMRLQDDFASVFGDFMGAAFAGMIGQAVAYLLMQKLGYPYGERLQTLVARIQTPGSLRPPSGIWKTNLVHGVVPKGGPDLIFENVASCLALAEAKGSFTAPNNGANFKQPLEKGLSQLSKWDEIIRPRPKKYAIGCFLREANDTNPEGSFVAFVDPDGDETPSNKVVNIPKNLVKRCNYANWLRLAGFVLSGNHLESGVKRENPLLVSLPVIELADARRFVIFHDPLRTLCAGLNRRFESVVLLGMEHKVVKAIEVCLENPESGDLDQLQPSDLENTSSGFSVFPDRSLLVVDLSSLPIANINAEVFII